MCFLSYTEAWICKELHCEYNMFLISPYLLVCPLNQFFIQTYSLSQALYWSGSEMRGAHICMIIWNKWYPISFSFFNFLNHSMRVKLSLAVLSSPPIFVFHLFTKHDWYSLYSCEQHPGLTGLDVLIWSRWSDRDSLTHWNRMRELCDSCKSNSASQQITEENFWTFELVFDISVPVSY